MRPRNSHSKETPISQKVDKINALAYSETADKMISQLQRKQSFTEPTAHNKSKQLLKPLPIFNQQQIDSMIINNPKIDAAKRDSISITPKNDVQAQQDENDGEDREHIKKAKDAYRATKTLSPRKRKQDMPKRADLNNPKDRNKTSLYKEQNTLEHTITDMEDHNLAQAKLVYNDTDSKNFRTLGRKHSIERDTTNSVTRVDKNPMNTTLSKLGSPTKSESNERVLMLQNKLASRIQDSKILCQGMTAEPFYRRAMKRLGWSLVEQKKGEQIKFHVRLNVEDLDGACNDMKPHQFYNHFPGNRQLTTKGGLCRNLWFNCFGEREYQITKFIPRCYDLSDLKQGEQFINDF